MGLVIGLFIIFITIWFYGAAKAAEKNAALWAAIGTATFIGTVIAGYLITYQIGSSFAGIGGDDETKPPMWIGLTLELTPAILGMAVAALVRNKYLKREP